MNLLLFLLRLIALPFLLAFFTIGTALYVIGMGFAWLLTGETILIYTKYPDWRR